MSRLVPLLAAEGEQYTCRYCGRLVLLCEAEQLVMHEGADCEPFKRAMASLGLPPGQELRGFLFDEKGRPN